MQMRVLILSLILMFVPLAGAANDAPLPEEVSNPTTIGQALIGFHDGYLPTESDSLAGLPVLATLDQINVAVVAAPDLKTVREATHNVPGIKFIEDDVLLHAAVTPNDARYNQQYGPAMMGAHDAWNLGYGTDDVIVAVLDTGILRTHEDFDAHRVLQGYDYVNNDNNPDDDCEHGTHVSGTVAATTDNGKGVAGMSQATILPYKVLGPVGGLFSVTCSGSTSDIAQAILDAVQNGADIISMSLGGGGTNTLKAAVDSAWNDGVLLVGAAGNDGNSNSVDYPAAYSSVIAVAALTSGKVRASYSDMGTQVEIAAPGSNVESTSDCSNTCYDSLSGTSMATPHVAGALALALSCDSSLTASTLRGKMQSTAEDLGSAGRDTSYGFGLMRIDDLLTDIGTCGGGSGNLPPSASFTVADNDKTVDLDASNSVDPEGGALSYSWTLGDGNTATGKTPSYTYSAYGTYTIGLTVTDPAGETGTTSQTITLADPTDPDPSIPNLQSGQSVNVAVSSGNWYEYKIQVPASASQLDVVMTGPGCGLTGCSFDSDLYVKKNAASSSGSYDCRPYQSGNSEQCNLTGISAGWFYVSVYGYTGSGTVTITATHNGQTGPVNNAPTAAFTLTDSGKTINLDGSSSSDPDGDTLSYAWTFGDGNTGTGETTSHTFANWGTYTVQLTVSDGNGASDTTSQTVVLNDPTDPDPSTPNLSDGVKQSIAISQGSWSHYKIQVPAGSSFIVDMTGPSCGVLGCNFDGDLYVKQGAKPTSASYDCRPYQSGNTESCSFSNVGGWYYVSVYGYSGSGNVDVTADYA